MMTTSSIEVKKKDKIEQITDEVNITDFKQLKDVGPATAKELRSGGYNTITELAAALPSVVATRCRMKKAGNAEELVAKANEFLREKGFLEAVILTGVEDVKRREALFRISTNSKNIDKLLNGGVESEAITEIFAENGVGKTQICNMVAINTTLSKELGGIEGNVLWIDTERTFRGDRITQICMNLGHNSHDVLSKIQVVRTQNTHHLIFVIENIVKLVEQYKIRLIIIDSIIALFRAETSGMGKLADRQQKLNHLLHILARCSVIYQLPILITNQVQDRISNIPSMAGGKIPTGGNVLGHTSTYRLKLSRGKLGLRKAALYKSPNGAALEVSFKISENGIEDPKEDKNKDVISESEEEGENENESNE